MSDEPILKRRVPLIAGFLSFVLPGLGQIYNRQLRKAMLFFVIGFVAWPVTVIGSMAIHVKPLNSILFFGVPLALWGGLQVDAIRVAMRTLRQPVELRRYNRWYVYLLIWIGMMLMVCPVTGICVRRCIGGNYRIVGYSMSPTVEFGDHVVANQLAFGLYNPINKQLLVRWASPQRQQVVVYHPPDDDIAYIGRVIGMPGDEVEVRDHEAYINGEPLDEPYAVTQSEYDLHRFSQFGPIAISPDEYLILGDDRPRSKDGRHFGLVSKDRIIAVAKFIYLSREEPASMAGQRAAPLPVTNESAAYERAIRWDRIGKLVE